MAVEEREIAAIRRLGLTEYESRLYLALVKMGPIKASEVSFFGQVPRTKAYGAIKELQRKGLLRTIPGKPELYAPSSPTEILMPLVNKLNREAKDSEDVVQSLALTYESNKSVKREVPKVAEQFWQIDGRQSIYNKLSQIMSEAKKSIDYSTSATGLIRAYKAHAEVLERARKRGALVRLLAPITQENSALAREFSAIVDLKPLDEPLAHFVSVDSRELVVIDSRPDDIRTDGPSDLAVWTTSQLLVDLYDHLFRRVWDTLPLWKSVR